MTILEMLKRLEQMGEDGTCPWCNSWDRHRDGCEIAIAITDLGGEPMDNPPPAPMVEGKDYGVTQLFSRDAIIIVDHD